MKKRLLLMAVLVFTGVAQAGAQCTTSVIGFGNNVKQPLYNVEGTVTTIVNSNETTVTLQLGADFKTAKGPDVRAYWVNPKGLTDSQLALAKIEDLERIPFGIISSNSIDPNGAKELTVPIPNGTPINTYTKVFFYCEAFGVFWDLGSLDSNNTTNCNSLSVNNFEFNQEFILYPNPSNEYITILSKNGFTIESIDIINLDGRLINVPFFNNKVDVSLLQKGVYILNIKTDKGTTTTKFIRR